MTIAPLPQWSFSYLNVQYTHAVHCCLVNYISGEAHFTQGTIVTYILQQKCENEKMRKKGCNRNNADLCPT